MISGMSLLPTTNVEAGTAAPTSDAYKDGYVFATGIIDDGYPPTSYNVVSDEDTINVGQRLWTDFRIYFLYRGFLSFDTSVIPDNVVVQSAVLEIYLQSKTITNSIDSFSVWAFQSDYGVSLDTADWGTIGAHEGTMIADAYNEALGFKNLGVSASGINKTGMSDYMLKSSRESTATPTDDEYITIISGDYGGGVYEPSLTVTYEEYATLVTIRLDSLDSYPLSVYPAIEPWNLTYNRYSYEIDTMPDTDSFSIDTVPDWEYLGSFPYADLTFNPTNVTFDDVADPVTYRIWFAVPMSAPKSTVHIGLYNEFTGEGFFWELMKVRISPGTTYDNSTSSAVPLADFEVVSGANYTIRVFDYFDNTLVDYSFNVVTQNMFITVPVPVYSWQVFNTNEQPVLMKIYWNNSGDPWEFFVGPQWIMERFLKGGDYTFAVTFYNNITVGSTVYYERTIPNAEVNASFIYISGTTLSEIITDIEGMIATQEIITSLISPSVVLIYENLPLAPVKIRSLALSAPIVIDPYVILEATAYQNVTGTAGVESDLWLPHPSTVGATYYNVSDVLSFSGTYDTTIYINDTAGTNIYYSTVLPAMVVLQGQNVTIWANENYSVSRMSTWREVSEYTINYYQTEHKWQTTLSLNNSMSFDYTSPYWYIAFPADAVIDLNTVTVYDIDNEVELDQRTNFDVTAGGIHVTLIQLNASDTRNFRFTFWDANSTIGIGAPNLVAEAYTQSTLDGVSMKYTAVQWANPFSVEYLGEVYITLNFTEGTDLVLSSITIIDETRGVVIPNSQWIYTGRTILILTAGVGTVDVAGARNYGIYFTLGTLVDRDEDKVDFFFGPIVFNGQQFYINDTAISWFYVALIVCWGLVGWLWYIKNEKVVNGIVLMACATIVGFYFSNVMG